jgi:DNA-binding PadR family transcriptional regulator
VREFRSGAVRLHVLHHAAEGEIHGAWMAAELAHHGHQISPGTLYPLLHRMESLGLLSSRQSLVEGRRRRLYVITEVGREVLAACRAALAELAREVLPTAAQPTEPSAAGTTRTGTDDG